MQAKNERPFEGKLLCVSKFNGYLDCSDAEEFTEEEKLTDGVMALSQNKERIIKRSMETTLSQFFPEFQFILEASKGQK